MKIPPTPAPTPSRRTSLAYAAAQLWASVQALDAAEAKVLYEELAVEHLKCQKTGKRLSASESLLFYALELLLTERAMSISLPDEAWLVFESSSDAEG